MWWLVLFFIYVYSVKSVANGDYHIPPSESDSVGSFTLNGLEVKEPIYHYLAFEGELVKATCRNSPGQMGTNQLTYYEESIMTDDAQGETMRIVSGDSIYIKLNDKLLDKGFTCDIEDHSPSDYYNRIHYYQQLQVSPRAYKDFSDSLMFVVNGLTLHHMTSSHSSHSSHLRYEYEYYEGEELNIIQYYKPLYKNTRQRIRFNCSIIGPKKPDVHLKKTNKNLDITSFTLRREHTNLQVSCQATDGNETRNMTLVLLYDTFAYRPFITGLSMSNILLKYKQSKKKTIIKYEYISKGNLSLTCSSKSKLIKYAFSNDEIESHVIFNEYHHAGHYHSKSLFTLRPNVNNATIYCKSIEHGIRHMTVLYLIRRIQKSTEQTQIEEISNGLSAWYSYIHELEKGTQIIPRVPRKKETKPTPTSTPNTPENLTAYGSTIEHGTENLTAYGSIIEHGTENLTAYGSTIEHGTETGQNIPDDLSIHTQPLEMNYNGNNDFIIFMMISCSGILAAISLCSVLAVRARRKKKALENASTDICAVFSNNEVILSLRNSEHVYETIPEHEHVYDVPTSQRTSNCSPAPDRDISQRPACPLPADAREEKNANVPYQHYDTPYDFRIFRIGVPVMQWPDRFTRRGNHNERRCSQRGNRF